MGTFEGDRGTSCRLQRCRANRLVLVTPPIGPKHALVVVVTRAFSACVRWVFNRARTPRRPHTRIGLARGRPGQPDQAGGPTAVPPEFPVRGRRHPGSPSRDPIAEGTTTAPDSRFGPADREIGPGPPEGGTDPEAPGLAGNRRAVGEETHPASGSAHQSPDPPRGAGSPSGPRHDPDGHFRGSPAPPPSDPKPRCAASGSTPGLAAHAARDAVCPGGRGQGRESQHPHHGGGRRPVRIAGGPVASSRAPGHRWPRPPSHVRGPPHCRGALDPGQGSAAGTGCAADRPSLQRAHRGGDPVGAGAASWGRWCRAWGPGRKSAWPRPGERWSTRGLGTVSGGLGSARRRGRTQIGRDIQVGGVPGGPSGSMCRSSAPPGGFRTPIWRVGPPSVFVMLPGPWRNQSHCRIWISGTPWRRASIRSSLAWRPALTMAR